MSTLNTPKKQRSKIIIDIINDNISIGQALELLDLLLEDLQDEKIKNWVNSEINGYSSKDELPEYRIVSANIVGTVRTYTAIISKYNIPIPLEETKKLCNIEIRDGINEIIQMAKAESETNNHCLVMPINIAYINSIACINGEVTHATRELSIYAYTNIIGKLKSKLLSILKELEKNYGNLDGYYIDFGNDSKEKTISQNIINIIYDNSVKIGDDNEIQNSIIGDENND